MTALYLEIRERERARATEAIARGSVRRYTRRQRAGNWLAIGLMRALVAASMWWEEKKPWRPGPPQK